MASQDETDFLEHSEDSKNIQKAFENGGVAAVNMVVSKLIHKWTETEINVAVTGNSGAGKSSFINALRKLTADDDGAAEVNVTETTMEPKSFKHPNNDKLLLWDLPGVGTPTFTRDTYLDQMDVNRYDYFVIMASCRFTENDLWIGQALKERKKVFYFVRTKLANDIHNDKLSHPRTHSEQTVIKTVRDNCLNNLVVFVDKVYLIDNYQTCAFDFPLLENALLTDAPALKKEAVLFTLSCMSERMIYAKKEALKKRIHYLALVSGICGFIPIPGLGVAVDMAMITGEIKFYQKQFGLCDTAKDKHDGPELKTTKKAGNILLTTVNGLEDYMLSIGAPRTGSKVFSIAYSILPKSTAGYSYCVYLLESLLEMAVEDAFAISDCMK